ncbi:hypothetical protein FDR72_08815 [Campylobacter helveticus]|uniref:hypothetical protein n=1 Tax=Campylobacter helveticus TaxID=28898 RepID=UPI001112BD2E|nr:hypothetical protein [Campylobacter helveticus]TNB59114.1 hypothetical protein FDR72_08815 [Campylobacter helveticus]
MSEAINEQKIEAQNAKTMFKLNEELSKLVFTLQKEVKNLKEDTLVNAQHLYMFKKLNTKSINTLNDEMDTHLKATTEFVENLGIENEKNNADNYSAFINTLLTEDFAKKQNEVIEELKREFNAKPKITKNKYSFLVKFSFALSLASFSLLMLICVKFRLFSQLF